MPLGFIQEEPVNRWPPSPELGLRSLCLWPCAQMGEIPPGPPDVWCCIPHLPQRHLSVNEAKLLLKGDMRHILFKLNADGTPPWNIFKSNWVTQPELPLLCFYVFTGLETSTRRPSGVFLTKGRNPREGEREREREREKLPWDRFSHGKMIQFFAPPNTIPFSNKTTHTFLTQVRVSSHVG